MAIPIDAEFDIPTYFGPGANPDFDKVLTSLGHIGSHKPTPVINTVMYWRAHKAKSDASADVNVLNRNLVPTPANISASAVAAITTGTNAGSSIMSVGTLSQSSGQTIAPAPPTLLRRQTEPASVVTVQGQENGTQYPNQRTTVAQHVLRDRQQRCAIYILCRALIEVVRHTSADALTEDVASKIEPIVFRELINQDAENSIRGGSVKSANWNIFAELLGCFSNVRYVAFDCVSYLRFSSVSDRFIEFLEKDKNVIPREAEGRVENVIHGMTYLKLKVTRSRTST